MALSLVRRYLLQAFCSLLLVVTLLFPILAHAQAMQTTGQKLRERWAIEDQLGANDQHFILNYGGLARRYNVHLPPSYGHGKLLPIVIYLHGGGGSIAAAYNDKMDEEADKLGFVLVIPAGTGPIPNHLLVWNVGRWDDTGCCGYAFEHNVDDVGFISAMIDQVEAKFPVDQRRVYATGISNGAAFAYMLGCALPDKITAVAPVAPPAVPLSCANAKPVTVVHVHGTGDTFAKYNGGTGGTLFPGAPGACFQGGTADGARENCPVQPTDEQISYWLSKDQCTHTPSVTFRNDAATCTTYADCAGGSEVDLCKIEGGGHTWPSGAQYAPVSLIGPVSYDMSFDQMFAYLMRHSLR